MSSQSDNIMLQSTAIPTGQTFTHFTYIPDLGANVLYIIIFSVFLLVQVGLGFRFRTWDYMGAMLSGIILELAGYTARIFMRANPSQRTPFLMDNICLILGPAFLAASIYLCMGRIVVVYGRHLSRLSPHSLLIIFILCDLTNLILQGVGGAISSTSRQRDQIQVGINVIIAGLATQVASLLIFIILGAEFAFRVRRRSDEMVKETGYLRGTRRWNAFLLGPLANDETTFMILEGAMMIIATGSLTLMHPGLCFQGHWRSPRQPCVQEPGMTDLDLVKSHDGTSSAVMVQTKELQ
ncbi:hypothetical protein ABVK25_004668 [Lepraria finkii]|uniref:Uncharacterized protein n=1 Tax=Lepraria finkii TaxID=1340010 RepID=A0ABR4BCS4_9LECA